MSIRQVKVNGRKVWQARVMYRGRRKSQVCATRDEAKLAHGKLMAELERKHNQGEQAGAAPATFRRLLDLYAEDMQQRGKAEESVSRVGFTIRTIAATTPDLLENPLARSGTWISSPTGTPDSAKAGGSWSA
jgi:hypothetical protein